MFRCIISLKWSYINLSCRCLGLLKGSELVFAGLQTKEFCNTNEMKQKVRAYELKAGLGTGSITPICCSRSFCNYNESSLSSRDTSIGLLRQSQGTDRLKFWFFTKINLVSFFPVIIVVICYKEHNISTKIFFQMQEALM